MQPLSSLSRTIALRSVSRMLKMIFHPDSSLLEPYAHREGIVRGALSEVFEDERLLLFCFDLKVIPRLLRITDVAATAEDVLAA